MSRLCRKFGIVATALAAALTLGRPAAAEDVLDVVVDQAAVIRLPEHVATIVVGNPLIADVSLQAGGMLVVTGKGYGSTNVVALDRTGAVLVDKTVRVQGPGNDVVVVYRGVQRETYSCQPHCERRITLGDGPDYFNTTISQTAVRNTQALGQQPQQVR
ncbi:MAG: pilus assembly protein N-terminal domain-containing protein [Variibacter sp.]|nr:pilus assembly protein N-terminal domain-containing protein [Variibacter sp.]